jgi:hypothetical protein
MPQPYVAPIFDAKAFNCPICHAYAQQYWQRIARHGQQDMAWLVEYATSHCTHCGNWLMWHEKKIIVPDVSAAPPVNDDLADDIKLDYAEAASIVARSPRGAAGLLRLCIQKLCKQLGESGKNVDADIGSLVKKGLDVRVQKALDTVRVVGNEAVHPGEMNLRDDVHVASQLFVLVNAIADQMITQPKLRDALYDALPQAKRDAIEARDKKARSTAA